jgi:hypothetical protein
MLTVVSLLAMVVLIVSAIPLVTGKIKLQEVKLR